MKHFLLALAFFFSAMMPAVATPNFMGQGVYLSGTHSDTLTSDTVPTLCSGFVVGDESPGFQNTIYIMTAGHCNSSDEGTIITSAHFRDGEVLKIDGVYHPAGLDVAILTAHYDFHKTPVTFDETPVYQGQKVLVYGVPEELRWALGHGYVLQGPVLSGLSENDLPTGDTFTFTIDCSSCGPGDSGAPVFSNDGKLVGMMVAGRQFPQANLMIPTAILEIVYNSFLDSR